MKRIALYALLLATGMFAGCSEDFTDWADPQGYGPEESELILFDATGVSAITMEDVTGDSIVIFTPSVSIPDGAVVTGYEVVLNETAKLEADTEGKVAVADLQTAVETLYGKRPEARTMTEVINVLVEMDGQVLTNSATTSLTVTLSAPFIASAYYLVGDFCGWDEETMIAFSHSDADVYDDPTFTVTFTTTAADQYWKIVPQTNIDADDFWHEGSDGIVGVAENGDASLEGTLVAVEGVGAGVISNEGTYRMTINMMDYTYEISALAGEYYLTGNPNSWASDASSMLYPEGDNVYSYTSQFNSSWDAKIWSGDELGDWDNIYGCDASMDNTPGDGTLVYSNGDQSTIGCLTSPAEGLYTLYVNMGTMAYWWEAVDQSAAEYDLVSITGDFSSWGDYIDMTEVAPHNWYVETNIPSDGGVKFLVDHAWDVNWGADLTVSTDTYYGVGTQDGSNITVPAGDYRIYLNDITGKFIFVAE